MHCNVGAFGNGGTTTALQVVAVDSKPDPVYVKTEFMLPELGDTVMLAVTLNTANCETSCAGEPLILMVQFFSSVANGPTTKVPVATVVGPIAHVGELSTTVFWKKAWFWSTPASMVQLVSDVDSPVARKLTVAPFVAFVG